MLLTVETFDWTMADHAQYVLGDGRRAVDLARDRIVAADIETAGLGGEAYQIKALSIGTADFSVVLDPDDEIQSRAFRAALAGASRIIVHNSPFDVPLLVNAGLMRDEDIDKVWDTLVSARMAYPSERGGNDLASAAARYLGPEYATWKDSLAHGYRAATGGTKDAMFRELDLRSPAYVAYSGFDPVMTARLDPLLTRAVHKRILDDLPFSDLGDPDYLLSREQTVNRVMLHRSAKGTRIDYDAVDELRGEMRAETSRADRELEAYGVDTTLTRDGIKRDTVRVMDEKGLLPAGYKRLADGRPSADQRNLKRVGGPIVEALERRSQAERFSSDYADATLALTDPEDRVHPQVNILAAKTGRMSVSNPAIQQMPPAVRRMFDFERPATSLDWASIEPVFIANIAGETQLIEEFEGGGDIYMPVAKAAGVPRKAAKVVLLAQIYGQGPTSLAGQLGVTLEQASGVVDAVMSRLPAIKGLSRKIRDATGGVGLVPTLSRRIIPVDRDYERGGYFGYKGVNYFVQGSCYDLLSEAIYEAHQQDLDDALFFAVHDELVVDTEAAEDFQRIMATPPPALCEATDRVPVLRTGRFDMPDSHWREKS